MNRFLTPNDLAAMKFFQKIGLIIKGELAVKFMITDFTHI